MKIALIDNRSARYECVGGSDTEMQAMFAGYQLSGRFVRIELWNGATLVSARDAA